MPKLGYWIAGEPLTKEAEERALIAAKNTRRRNKGVKSLVALGKGKPKGPPSALSAEQVAAAERMLLAGQSLTEVAAFFGVAIRTLALRLPGGGLGGLKAKHPDVVIPKRPYVYRPPRPGHKPLGRPRTITEEQDKQIADLRAEGLSMQKIADALGLKRSTVYASISRQERDSDRKKEDDARSLG
jgi:DNA invertase Pin-like site-specific DNA recombinase